MNTVVTEEAFQKMSTAMKNLEGPLLDLGRTLRTIQNETIERQVTMQLREDILEMGVIDGTVLISLSPR